jgi:hypothetical protein
LLRVGAEKPVYLWLRDGKAELRDAKHLWGKDTHDTTDTIIEELAPEVGKDEAKSISVACIGPAGERLAKIACIINDKNRATGRGGHGAVWGSKNLKAIAAYGNMKPPVANEEMLEEVAEAGDRIASIDPHIQVTVLDYFPTFRRRLLKRPTVSEMLEVKRVLEERGLKTVIVQTERGHVGPGERRLGYFF